MSTYMSSFSEKQTMPVNGFPGENHLRDLQFRLTHNLQSTLDLQTTLESFFVNIQEAVAISSMELEAPEMKRAYTLGTQSQHSVRYNLSSERESIGVIRFTRSKKFFEAELAILETMLSILYFPLRNALLYRRALENSWRDPLTGIGNRAALDASFKREIKLAHRHNYSLSLLVIDIDHFKKINDEFGHHVGDKVIKHIVKAIDSTLRETDQIFRFGGEEFVVMFNNTPHSSAKLAAERIRTQCAQNPFKDEFSEIPATLSIGISTLRKSDNAESLFERADKAVYKAKSEGRNRVVCDCQPRAC